MAMSNNQRSKSHRRRVAAVPSPWYLATGEIDPANCLEAVQLPTQGQLYTGATVASGQPWTIAVRTVWSSATRFVYYFGAQTPDLRLGRYNKYYNHQVFTTALAVGSTFQGSIADLRDCVLFVVSDGSGMTGYLDNSAGATFVDSAGLEGTCRWRSAHGGGSLWPQALPYAAAYNIALDATQRAALYSIMAP
jgi:hypothetical protein